MFGNIVLCFVHVFQTAVTGLGKLTKKRRQPNTLPFSIYISPRETLCFSSLSAQTQDQMTLWHLLSTPNK